MVTLESRTLISVDGVAVDMLRLFATLDHGLTSFASSCFLLVLIPVDLLIDLLAGRVCEMDFLYVCTLDYPNSTLLFSQLNTSFSEMSHLYHHGSSHPQDTSLGLKMTVNRRECSGYSQPQMS